MPVKVYSLSDLHVDYQDNMQQLLRLNSPEYRDAALILAGDATDHLDKLATLLRHFVKHFAVVLFVPGNHELWIRRDEAADSIEKFQQVLALCDELGVHTRPLRFGQGDGATWLVPLFSWYTKPEQGDDSLYRPKKAESDKTERIWSDNHFCQWTSLDNGLTPNDYFLGLNEPATSREYDAPVISFSHFLPHQQLIFRLDYLKNPGQNFEDPLPQFNFSRVAGSTRLDEQIRRIGSTIHIYGHQHRDRHRLLDGVTYISHCFGYPAEREGRNAQAGGLNKPPMLVWRDGPVGTPEDGTGITLP